MRKKKSLENYWSRYREFHHLNTICTRTESLGFKISYQAKKVSNWCNFHSHGWLPLIVFSYCPLNEEFGLGPRWTLRTMLVTLDVTHNLYLFIVYVMWLYFIIFSLKVYLALKRDYHILFVYWLIVYVVFLKIYRIITPYIRMLDSDWLIAVIFFYIALWICRIFTSCRCICIRFNFFSWYLQNRIFRVYPSPRRL